jgi:protein-S-isoprenylcysteine O-methyltransferase Ste14
MENEESNIYKNKVHKILARSYSVYFFFFLVGIYLNLFFNFKVFMSSIIIPIGFLFLVLGTFLAVWAQNTSRKLNTKNITKETFSKGPYRFTSTPTNFGLFFLMLGFGMVTNSLFGIVCSCVAFLIARFIFLEQEEKVLAEKYGTPYLEYKKIVKF